jgi:hypothetical protein
MRLTNGKVKTEIGKLFWGTQKYRTWPNKFATFFCYLVKNEVRFPYEGSLALDYGKHSQQ